MDVLRCLLSVVVHAANIHDTRSAISSPNPASMNCIISSNLLSKDRIELVRPSTWSANFPLKIKFPTTIVTIPVKHGTNAHARERRKICVKENKRHPFSQESEQGKTWKLYS